MRTLVAFSLVALLALSAFAAPCTPDSGKYVMTDDTGAMFIADIEGSAVTLTPPWAVPQYLKMLNQHVPPYGQWGPPMVAPPEGHSPLSFVAFLGGPTGCMIYQWIEFDDDGTYKVYRAGYDAAPPTVGWGPVTPVGGGKYESAKK